MEYTDIGLDYDFAYSYCKSESPTCVEPVACSQHQQTAILQCPSLKTVNGMQLVGTQYHHQDQQTTFHQFHSLLQQIPPCSTMLSGSSLAASPIHEHLNLLGSKFSYTLVAQTLPAVKLTEEPITCLNQGQSYDVKLKKQVDTSPAKYYKINIRLMFHHRRLQHSEQEQFQSWLTARPDQRLLELDRPLAYNVLSPKEDPRTPNMATITWSGQTEASVSVKINCISTEFTAKKHGGEKGVPFRLQVDTYAVLDEDEQNSQLVHRAYCLVKVFKPNGADRKNKNDSVKLLKIPVSERELYHPTYDITTFSEVQPHQYSAFSPTEWVTEDYLLRGEDRKTQQLNPISPAMSNCPHSVNSSSNCPSNKPNDSPMDSFSPDDIFNETERNWNDVYKSEHRSTSSQPILTRSSSSLFSDSSASPPPMQQRTSHEGTSQQHNPEKVGAICLPLHPDCLADDLQTWLRQNNFEKWVTTFKNYSGAEMFMLNKDDFIKICGVADGIRLFYKIYPGLGPSTKLSLYISYPAGTERKLYIRKNFSSESLESQSPSSVSSTVTTGSCSNLLANTISDMSLDHPQQIKTTSSVTASFNHVDLNSNLTNSVQKGAKRTRDSNDVPSNNEIDDENNNSDHPHVKKNKCSDERDIEIPTYFAVYLRWLTYSHLIEKLADVFNIPAQSIAHVYLVDRDGTYIAISDDVVKRLNDHSIFTMDVLSDGATRRKVVFLTLRCQKDR